MQQMKEDWKHNVILTFSASLHVDVIVNVAGVRCGTNFGLG